MIYKESAHRQRLDQHIVEKYPRLSRAYVVRLIEDGKVLVNDRIEKPGYKIRETDIIHIDFDEASLDVIPEIELPVLYEDENVIVIDKPIGVISHSRGKYWDEPSVASFVRQRMHTAKPWSGEGVQPTRAGIVHRLDRPTSGVMVCAKNPDTLKFLQKQFGDRSVKKSYIAVVRGHMEPEEAIIDVPIDRNPKAPSSFRADPKGKTAQSHYIVQLRGKNHDELLLRPQTGRTHQLRVHLSHVGHPIVGDQLYGGEQAERLLLHAFQLEITLPGGERKTFEAPIPPEFRSAAES